MIESQIQAKITQKLKNNGWFVTKLIQTSTNGIPDLMAIKEGRVIFLEIKQPGKKASPLQDHQIEGLNRCGVEAKVVSSVEEIEIYC